MKKIVIFYTFSSFLLVFLHWHEENQNRIISKPSGLVLFVGNQLKPSIKNAGVRNSFIRLVTGLNAPLLPKFKTAIDHCFLWSLYSLNGLHIYLIFFYLLRKKWSLKQKIYRIIKKNLSPFNKIVSDFKIHFAAIILTAIIIILAKSFASGCFYFILVGTFYISKDETKIDTALLSVMSYLLFSIYFEKNFSSTGFLFSAIVFWMFKKSFRFLLILFIIGLSSITNNFLNPIAESIYTSLIFLGNIATIDQTHNTTFLFILILIAVLTKKYQVLILFFIFHSEPVFTPVIIYSK